MTLRHTISVFALLMSTFLSAAAETKMTIITSTGSVSFVADENWPVLTMQTKLPVATVAFQLPNAGDANTDHSTNLVLQLFDPQSEKGKSAYAAPQAVPGGSNRQERQWEGWAIVRHDAQQGGIDYTVFDASRPDIGDVSGRVRLAWPSLDGNAASYDADVQARFRDFLKSIQWGKGAHIPEKGEDIRRQK
jgi:hypothetical protein